MTASSFRCVERQPPFVTSAKVNVVVVCNPLKRPAVTTPVTVRFVGSDLTECSWIAAVDV